MDPLDDFPLNSFLLSKYEKFDFYIVFQNEFANILEIQNPSEYDLSLSWNTICVFVFMFGVYLGDESWQVIYDAFFEVFNHSEGSPMDLLVWHFSDFLNDTLLNKQSNWEIIKKYPMNLSSLVKTTGGVDTNISIKIDMEIFYKNYIKQGGGHFKKPIWDKIQIFTKVALKLIEVPKIKSIFELLSDKSLYYWLPKEIQELIDSMGILTIKDGKMLISGLPLLHHWKIDYEMNLLRNTVPDPLEIYTGQIPEKQKKKRQPQDDTVASLEALRKIKSEAIMDKNPIPTRAVAMDLAGITDKTWRAHDLDLYTSWYVKKIRKKRNNWKFQNTKFVL